jgi:hypothetical protein
MDDTVVEFEIHAQPPRMPVHHRSGFGGGVTFDKELKLHAPVVHAKSGEKLATISSGDRSPDLCPRYTARW